MTRIRITLVVILCGFAIQATSQTTSKTTIQESTEASLMVRDYPVLEATAAASGDQKPDLNRALTKATELVAFAQDQYQVGYFGFARQVLAPWWDQTLDNETFRLLRAVILQNQHQFEASIRDLNWLLERNPGNATARLTRAAVYQVTGNLDAAEADCRALLLKADTVVVLNCLAQVKGLVGQARRMDMAIQSMLNRSAHLDARMRTELRITRAELLQIQGRQHQAGELLKQVLADSPDHPAALGLLSQSLLDAGQASQLIELMQTRSGLMAHLYHAIALAIEVDNSGNGRGGLEFDSTSIESELNQMTRLGDADGYRWSALYHLHVVEEPKKACEFAGRNWAFQKTVNDALLFIRSCSGEQSSAALATVGRWVKHYSIADVRLQAAISLKQAYKSVSGAPS